MAWLVRRKGFSVTWGVVALLVFTGACAAAGGGSEAASEPNAGPSVTATPAGPQPPKVRSREPRAAATKKDAANRPSAAARPRRAPMRERPVRKRYAVHEVVDGDTVQVAYRGGESVRVIGIDTPETVHPSVPDECGGAAASAAAERILSGKRVALVFDRSQGRRDYYGRMLAYIQVPGTGDFGLTMIKRGLAAEYTYDTAYARQARYRRAQTRAQAAGKAIWTKCGGVDTPATQPQTTAQPRQQTGGGRCEPGYDPCVPPYPPDVDCSDVDGPIRVTGSDPHGLDGDGDGSACES